MLSLPKHLPKPNTGGKILRFAQDDKKGTRCRSMGFISPLLLLKFTGLRPADSCGRLSLQRICRIEYRRDKILAAVLWVPVPPLSLLKFTGLTASGPLKATAPTTYLLDRIQKGQGTLCPFMGLNLPATFAQIPTCAPPEKRGVGL